MFELFGAQLREAQITCDKFVACKSGSDSIDEAMLARVRQVFGEQRNLLPGQREQVQHWQSEATTHEQRDMLDHLTARADLLSALHEQIFAVVGELARDTIDQIMDTNDDEPAALTSSGS